MPTLEQIIAMLSANPYIYSLLILVLSLVASKLIVYISQKVILRLAEKTKTKVDDLIIEKTDKPISLIIVLIGIKLAVIPLGLSELIARITNYAIFSLIIIIITYILIVVFGIIIDAWGKRWAARTKSDVDNQVMKLFHRFSKIILLIIGLMFVLDLWGVDIMPIITSLGIAGIAIAFALQNTLGNIFGGISVILDKSVKSGDVIKLDNETYGTVLDVGLRSTKIKTWNNEVIVIPNGKLADSRIQNYVLPEPSARIELPFSVEYGSNVDKVKKVVLNEIKKLKNVLKDPEPKVMFIEMADFSLNFKAYFWVPSYKERFETKEKANCLIYNALNKTKIGIPFPTRTIYMKKGK